MEQMFKVMVDEFKEVKQNQEQFQATQKIIIDRLGKIEASNAQLEAKHDNLTKSVQDVEQDVAKLKEDVAEEMRKIKKANNLILFGVPETEEGKKLAVKLIQIISPTTSSSLARYERLGNPPQLANPTKPRPLRIRLLGHGEREAAIRNCHLLKGNKEMAGISVERDLTRAEQMRKKQRSPIQTRSQKRRTTEGGGPSSKYKRKRFETQNVGDQEVEMEDEETSDSSHRGTQGGSSGGGQ